MMDSLYKQYLDTNYSPTAEEAQCIQSIIEAATPEVVALKDKINELRLQLDPLEQKLSNAQNSLEKHQALLSPVRSLTQDILENIFFACLPSDRTPCMSALEAPMLLTRICSSWRRLALSTPRLWAAIHIVVPNVALTEKSPTSNWLEIQLQQVNKVLERREAAVSEWLARSGACPLWISLYQATPYVDYRHDVYDLYDEHFKKFQERQLSFIVNTIIPHHQRWRELDVRLSDDTLKGILDIGFRADSLKVLKALHVTLEPCLYDRREELPAAHLWKDAISLLPSHATSASFQGINVHSSDISFIQYQSWGGLTELHLSLSRTHVGEPAIVTVNVAAEVLCHCPSLVTLTLLIYCYEQHAPGHQSTDSIVLQHLRTLNIELPLSPTGLTFAKRLRLPSLAELSVRLSGFAGIIGAADTADVSQEILRSLVCSGGHILTLALGASDWMNSSDHLVQLLKLCSDLKSLAISDDKFFNKWIHYARSRTPSFFHFFVDDRLLKALNPNEKGDSEILCPMLEEFVCARSLKTGVTEGGLKDFVKARMLDERVPNIRCISIFINEYKKPVVSDERIVLGAGSAVYFKKLQPIKMSPFDGYERNSYNDRTLMSIGR